MTAAPFPATSMPDRDWWAALWPDPEGVLRQLGIGPGMSLLDLCCGDGYFTAPLARLTGGKVWALDQDPAMLQQARAEVARQGGAVRQWIAADALALAEHLEAPVDAVLLANTFHGVPDPARLAVAVRAVLRPGGCFVIVNWHKRPREETRVGGQPRGPRSELRLSPRETAALLAPVGFRSVRLVELPPFHYGLVLMCD